MPPRLRDTLPVTQSPTPEALMEDSHPGTSQSAFAELMAPPHRDIDLSRAALLIAQGEYPDLDIPYYLHILERLGRRVRSRSTDASPKAAIEALNRVLFEEEDFRGNEEEYYDPRNSYLNEVIDRRIGIPITLSVVYIEVARHAGIEIKGVGFPGHFIVKRESEDGPIYIDPFYKGLILDMEHLAHRLRLTGGGFMPFREHHLAACTEAQLVTRMLNNLKGIHASRRDYEKALTVIEMMIDVSPWDLDEVRDRGKVRLQLKDYSTALVDLETYLNFRPDAEDAEVIGRSVQYLKGLAPRGPAKEF